MWLVHACGSTAVHLGGIYSVKCGPLSQLFAVADRENMKGLGACLIEDSSGR